VYFFWAALQTRPARKFSASIKKPGNGFSPNWAEMDFLTLKFNVMQFPARLVSDARLRETKTGKKVTSFTVALNKSFKNSEGEKVQRTTYVDCSYWNRPNITGYLTKGLLIALSGFITANAWVDRDGHARAGIRMEVDDIDFLTGSKKIGQSEESEGQQEGKQGTESVEVVGEKDDDLPF
jgi:single-strand DNA-binding protein